MMGEYAAVIDGMTPCTCASRHGVTETPTLRSGMLEVGNGLFLFVTVCVYGMCRGSIKTMFNLAQEE